MKRNIKKVLVITTNWNDHKRTYRCLSSLMKLKYISYDILIVDNNSEEKNYKLLKKSINKIKNKKFVVKEIKKIDYKKKLEKNSKIQIFLIKSKINTGCTGGYNIGYHFGNISGYDYVSRIDNDCIVSNDYLEKMVTYLDKNKSYVGLNSKVCYLQKKNYIQWVGSKFSYKLIFYRSTRIFKKTKFENQIRANLEKNWKGIISTDALNGPGSLIRSAVFKKTKYSDIEFFFGPEDIELSNRIKRFGKIAVFLDSKIYHEVAQSSKLTGLNKRLYYEYKSQILLIRKIYSFPIFCISILYFILGLFVQTIIYKLIYNKKNDFRINMKYLALMDYLNNNLGISDLIQINKEKNKKKYIKEYLKIFN